MKLQTLILTTVLSSVALSACAGSGYNSSYSTSNDSAKTMTVAMADTVVMTADTAIGEVFANADGMTLYTFTKDAPGVSNCYDGCAANWPPFYAKKDAKTWGDFTVIKRTDDSYQWAYKNQPLYTWVGDRKQGDINGQGVGNVWYAAQPGK